MKKNSSVRFLTESAVIAALYAVLTYAAAMVNLAYGPIQFRFSEALTVLPVFTASAIPGLSIGCLIANLGSSLGVVDWVFGTLATLLAALLSRALRDIKFKGIPILSIIAPVVMNAVVIGLEIACLSEGGLFSFSNLSAGGFWAGAISVGLGELVICLGLGIPLFLAVQKSRLNFSNLSTN